MELMETKAYKDQLEEMLSDITKELKDLGIQNPEVQSDWIAIPESASDAEADPNVSADRVEDWDERRATLSLLEERYNNVTRALKKIEEVNYGACEVCGEPIETERLQANPAARTCIKHLEEEAKLDT